MNTLMAFLRDCKTELTQHVTWSKFSEVQKTSVMVLVASLIFALVIAGMDLVIDGALEQIYQIFS